MPHGNEVIGETTVFNRGPDQFVTPLNLFAALQGGKDGDKIKLLEATHPLYNENRRLWRELGDVALNRIDTRADKMRYLVRGRSELDWMWTQRVALSTFLPETPGLLSDFVGAVFSKAARREFAKPEKDKDGNEIKLDTGQRLLQEKVQAFIDDAGMGIQPLARVAQEAARLALVYGSCDTFLDHPPTEDDATETPEVILYTPEQRLDWQMADDGTYAWVKYKESFTEKKSTTEGRIRVDEYRIVIAPMIDVEDNAQQGVTMLFRVVRRGNKQPEIEDQDVFPFEFNSIPVRTLYWKKLEEGLGESWVKPLVSGDIKVFRQESDLAYSIFKNAQPVLKVWKRRTPSDMEDGGPDLLREIKLGGAWAIPLDPGGIDGANTENVEYLELPTAELTLQADIAKSTREQIRKMAGNDSNITIDKGGMPESGVALAYRQAQRAKNFVQLAQNLQEWEWQVLELVANEGVSTDVELSGFLEVIYPDRFDQRLTEELDRDLAIANDIGSKTLIGEVRKQMAAVLIGDGATAELLARVNEEIENSFDTGGGTKTDEGTLNAQALAIRGLIELGDFELANSLRRLLALEHGMPEPAPLTEADVIRRSVAPVPRVPNVEA